MKRSVINAVYREAKACFENAGWALPPSPRWDITDFGLGDFDNFGLILINLAEQPEYCEKLMYARMGQRTPAHTHHVKKEDIICRSGQLVLQLWSDVPGSAAAAEPVRLQVNGQWRSMPSGNLLSLEAGERVTLTPGIYHEFWPGRQGTIIGEVSTANDDLHDNIFLNPDIGRFPGIEEDEPAVVRLVSE